MKFTRRQQLILMGAGTCDLTWAQTAEARILAEWSRIAHESDGVLGAAAFHLESGRCVSLLGRDRFPLASVCKLPIAINILSMVDEGRLALNENIEIPLYDVFPGVSETADRWPKQKRFPLNQMLEWMVAKSDNTAVQVLFRIGGGAEAMATRFRQWKVTGIRIDRSERQCALESAGVEHIPPVSEWTPQKLDALEARVPDRERLMAMQRFIKDSRDTATPEGTVELFSKAFRGELLSKELTQRLIEILKATTTGSARIKGLLPDRTVVAHKTGTTATAMHLNGSTNDVGVIMLPGNAGRLAVAAFLKGSMADASARDKVIARVAKIALDAFSGG